MKQTLISMKQDRKMWIYMICGLLVGIIAAQTIGKNAFTFCHVFSESRLSTFSEIKIRRGELFLYLLEKRMLLLVFISLLGISYIGKSCASLGSLWIGFFGSSFLVLLIQYRGIQGVWMYFAMFFPQGLCYLPALFFIFHHIYRLHEQSGYATASLAFWRMDRKRILIYLTAVVMTGILILVGVFLEAYLNPFFLKKIIQAL